MIKISNDFRLVGKDLNFVLENKQIIKEHFMTNPEKVGTKKWTTIGYFTTFSSIEKFLETKTDIEEEKLVELKSIFEQFNEVVESFKTIEVPRDMHLKIIINKDWYCVGSHMFYRVIKRESIKKHRFTKEENIGKDKFINTGAVPNMYIALKSILNILLLDYLTEDDYGSLNEIKQIIENFKLDAQNINFVEIQPNTVEEEIEEAIEEDVEEAIEEDVEEAIEEAIEEDVEDIAYTETH